VTGYNGWCGSGNLYNAKWYKHEDDMNTLSMMYPNHSFVLDGVGEEYPDVWKLYAKNGRTKKVEAIISFPPVDLDLLI
jgi:hypothetical protein